jgi:hypothetical protein
MLGHEGVTQALHQSILQWLPQVADQMRTELGLDETGLRIPAPKDIHPVMDDAIQIGRFPALMINELETGPRSTTRQSAGSGDLDKYLIRYRFRIYLWVTGAGYRSTGAAIKRLTTAARTTLLVNRILFDNGKESAITDPKSFKEVFSDVAGDTSTKYLAGSYIELEVMTTELLRAVGTDAGLTATFDMHTALIEDA